MLGVGRGGGVALESSWATGEAEKEGSLRVLQAGERGQGATGRCVRGVRGAPFSGCLGGRRDSQNFPRHRLVQARPGDVHCPERLRRPSPVPAVTFLPASPPFSSHQFLVLLRDSRLSNLSISLPLSPRRPVTPSQPASLALESDLTPCSCRPFEGASLLSAGGPGS